MTQPISYFIDTLGIQMLMVDYGSRLEKLPVMDRLKLVRSLINAATDCLQPQIVPAPIGNADLTDYFDMEDIETHGLNSHVAFLNQEIEEPDQAVTLACAILYAMQGEQF